MGVSKATVLRRVEKFREAMRTRGLVAVAVYAAPMGLSSHTVTSGNVRYLTNWKSPYVSLGSLLLLPADGAPVLFVHNPFAKRFAEEQDLWVRDIRGEASSGAIARRLLGDFTRKSDRVGIIGGAEMPTGIYQGLTAGCECQFEATDDLIAYPRAIKDPEEIEMHREAAAISDAMMFAGMTAAHAPHVHAHALMVTMEGMGRQLGAEYARCWLDAGSAPTSKYQPWQLPDEVREGDRVQAGTYVIHEGYWAHELRVGVRGTPTSEQKYYMDFAVEVQDAALHELKAGRQLRKAVAAMESLIDQNHAVRRWGSLGHGLGLQYEDPLVTDAFPQPFPDSGRSEADTELVVEPGMVLELHPNFIVPDLGTFYMGDVVLITEAGPELLTRFPRELYRI